MKKPILIWALTILILFISISALFGGLFLIKDPSGKSLQFPDNFLKNTFFQNYFVPGIILFLALGIFPLFIIYGLFKKDSLNFLEFFNIYNDKKWQFSFLIYYGLALIIWINVQIMLVPYFVLQPVISLLGVLIIILSLTKGVRKYYLK